MAQQTDYSGIEISAKTRGPRNARILTVYIEAPYYRDIEEVGIGCANVLASKRGYKFLSGATVWPVEQSATGLYQSKVEYTERRV
jgi:hypothetical protein